MANFVRLTQVMLLAMSAYVYQQAPEDEECTICKPGTSCEQPAETKEMGRRRR